MSSQAKPFITPEEYLSLDSAAEVRSEYWNGEMFAMSGGTGEHAEIIDNTQTAFNTQLRGTGCKARSSNLRVFIPATGAYLYPDLSVTCGPPLYQGAGRDTLLNPILIVEVLSPSTENYDRGAKFRQYRSIPSLREYLLISAREVHVEQFVAQEEQRWLLTEYSDLADVLAVQAAPCRIPLSRFYEEVSL